MTVVSLSLERILLARFDKIWRDEGFQNRSEAIRGAIRSFIEKYEYIEDNGEETETIVIFSYEESKSVRDRLNLIQHQSMNYIKETLHRHIHDKNCFELLTLKGPLSEINPIINRIRSTREIKSFHSFSFYL